MARLRLSFSLIDASGLPGSSKGYAYPSSCECLLDGANLSPGSCDSLARAMTSIRPTIAGQRPIEMPDGTWAEAVRRAAVIRPLTSETTSRPTAVQAAADALGISVSRVYRLVRAFRRRPLTQSLVLNKPGPRPGTRVLSPEVELRIEDAIETVFKQRERPSVARLRRDIRQNCEAAGLAPPSRKAIEARISAQSLKDIVKARDGAKIAQQRFALVKPGLRPRTLLDVVQIDHTKVDIQLVDDLARAVLGRPWLTLLLDVHSRCVLGLSVSFDPPSAAGVALALAQGVLPKTEWLADRGLDLTWPMHGLPRLLHLDNGREFHSRALRRGCQQHGLGLDYRPPATPRFGGHIERLMGTLMQRVHALPGSTASSRAGPGPAATAVCCPGNGTRRLRPERRGVGADRTVEPVLMRPVEVESEG